MVSSAAAWLAVTSAPLVTVEMPILPLIGAVTRVYAQVDPGGLEGGAVLLHRGLGLLERGLGVVVVLQRRRT